MNTATTNKPIKKTVLNLLRKNADLYSPLKISSVEPINNITASKNGFSDLVIRISYLDSEYLFNVEVKNRSVPSVIFPALSRLNFVNNYKDANLALIVPNLNNSLIELLTRYKVSAFDLNGNYFIITKSFNAVRLDKKNNFPENSTIKNVYAGNTSIVGRALLTTNKTFSSVNELFDEIQNLNGNISLSAVSKALTRLSEDLIIDKTDGIKLIQPDKLLNNLIDNYTLPIPYQTIRLKLPVETDKAKSILENMFEKNWMFSGESSLPKYAISTPTNNYTVYANDFSNAFNFAEYINERFYNYTIYLFGDKYNYIYFNSKNNYASKLQCLLELMKLGKREKEIGEDIKEEILNEFGIRSDKSQQSIIR